MSFIEKYSAESELYYKTDTGVRCLACNFNCNISEGRSGNCGVRFNKDGKLFVPDGYVSALNIDPIEKKPVYHFIPGSMTLSFSNFGCNFKCDYCQNWELSQLIKSDKLSNLQLIKVSPLSIYDIAKQRDIKVIVSTYNEPVISIELARKIFKNAKEKDKSIKTGFVSNGYISRDGFNYIRDYIDFIRIDLKSFNKNRFRKLTGADLDLLLKSIEMVYKAGKHIELVTLVVTDFNDSIAEIKQMINFIKSLSSDIPWHLTKFHPDYRMIETPQTDEKKIEGFIETAKDLGLKYVYGGNYNTQYCDTICPNCSYTLIKRGYMSIIENKIKEKDGKGFCPKCGYEIYGVF